MGLGSLKQEKEMITYIFEGDNTDFMAACKAMELYKDFYDETQILVTNNEHQRNYGSKAWFVDKSTAVLPANTDYKYAIRLEADVNKTKEMEFLTRRRTKEEIDKRVKEIAKANGILEEQVQKPDFYPRLDPNAPPEWNLVKGYCEIITFATELPIDTMPEDYLIDTITVNKSYVREKLYENYKKESSQKFIVLAGAERLKSMGVTRDNLPPMYSIVEDSEDILFSVGAVQHPNCIGSIGFTSPAIYSAASEKKLTIEVFEDMENLHWRYCGHRRSTLIPASHPQFVEALSQTTRYRLSKDLGVTW